MCIFSFATNGKAMESVTHLLFQTRKHLICIETPFEASFAIIMNIGKTTMVSQWEFCQKFQCTNCSSTWIVSFRKCIYFYIGIQNCKCMPLYTEAISSIMSKVENQKIYVWKCKNFLPFHLENFLTYG